MSRQDEDSTVTIWLLLGLIAILVICIKVGEVH